MSSGSTERRQISAAPPQGSSPILPPSACEASSRIGNPVRPQSLDVGHDAQGVRHEDGLCPFLHERGSCWGSMDPDSSSTSATSGTIPLSRSTRSQREGASAGRITGSEARQAQGFQRHRHGEVAVAQRDPPGMSQQVARARDKLAGDLAGADLVGDDAGQDAPHVLSFHRRPENWYCHGSRYSGAGAPALSTPCRGDEPMQVLFLFGKPARADQRHEPAPDASLDVTVPPTCAQPRSPARPPIAHGNDQDPVVRELVAEPLRNRRRCGGHEDPVERRLLGPALAAVPGAKPDVRIAEIRQRALAPPRRARGCAPR